MGYPSDHHPGTYGFGAPAGYRSFTSGIPNFLGSYQSPTGYSVHIVSSNFYFGRNGGWWSHTSVVIVDETNNTAIAGGNYSDGFRVGAHELSLEGQDLEESYDITQEEYYSMLDDFANRHNNNINDYFGIDIDQFGNICHQYSNRTVRDLESYESFTEGIIDAFSDFTDGVNDGISSLYPVVIDLDGDGVEIVQNDLSVTSFDVDEDGFAEQTAWVSPDDAFVVIDLAEDGSFGADGVIDQTNELAFANWTEDETDTDLEAMAAVFDSNGDGVFDEHDEHFEDFRIWQDLNQNGRVDEGELKTRINSGLLSLVRSFLDPRLFARTFPHFSRPLWREK